MLPPLPPCPVDMRLNDSRRDHEEAEDVDVEETPRAAQVHIRDRGFVVDPGVIDHRRDRAELLIHGIEHAQDIVLAADIRLDGDRALPGFLDLRDDLAGAVFGLAVVDRDIVAARPGSPRDSSTNAAASARHDHDVRRHLLLPEMISCAPRTSTQKPMPAGAPWSFSPDAKYIWTMSSPCRSIRFVAPLRAAWSVALSMRAGISAGATTFSAFGRSRKPETSPEDSDTATEIATTRAWATW